MRIVQVIIEVWLGSAALATFAWCGTIELNQWRARRRERAYRRAVAEADAAQLDEWFEDYSERLERELWPPPAA